MKETKQSTRATVDAYAAGNKDALKHWVRKATKKDILDAIEHYSGNHGSRHIIINEMRFYLDKEK